MLPLSGFFFSSYNRLYEREVMIYLGPSNSQQLVSLTLPTSDSKNPHQNLDMDTSGEKNIYINLKYWHVSLPNPQVPDVTQLLLILLNKDSLVRSLS